MGPRFHHLFLATAWEFVRIHRRLGRDWPPVAVVNRLSLGGVFLDEGGNDEFANGWVTGCRCSVCVSLLGAAAAFLIGRRSGCGRPHATALAERDRGGCHGRAELLGMDVVARRGEPDENCLNNVLMERIPLLLFVGLKRQNYLNYERDWAA